MNRGTIFVFYHSIGTSYDKNERKMLDLQHQYNNCTTTPHMRVSPTHWGPPSSEGLLCSCCIGVVQELNPFNPFFFLTFIMEINENISINYQKIKK
jgi:hypothetical protein